MRLLVVRGNPRKTGYVQAFTDLFLEGARSAEADICDVDLTTKHITPCEGCYHCWIAEPGQCIHQDDMNDLLQEFIAADVVVCATPLYYYSMSSRLQTFFERTLPLTQAGLDEMPNGLFRNQTRFPEQWRNKKLIFLVIGALRDKANFQPFVETCRLIADGMAMELGGILVRPESHLTGFDRAKPTQIKRIRQAFIEAGREAATSGTVSERVLQEAAACMESEQTCFKHNSDLYWDTAHKMGRSAMDTAAVVAEVSKDARIILRQMVSSVDPLSTSQTDVTLQLDFADKDLYFCIAIDHGTASLVEQRTEKPDLRISCDAEVWTGIATREIDPRQALREGSVKLEGNRLLFSRLARFFPVMC